MAAPVTLELFETRDAKTRTMFLSANRLADLCKQSFDRGYAEGVQAANSETKAQEAAIAKHLIGSIQDISFTNIEARRVALNSLEPLISRFIKILIPPLSEHALAEIVVTQTMALAERLVDGSVAVTCAPVAAPALKAAIEREKKLAGGVVVAIDPTCKPSEVRITSPKGERHINLDQAVGEIRDSVTAFYQLLSED